MGVRDEEMAHHIFVAGLHADQALAAAPLLPVLVQSAALDVAGLRGGNHHVFVGNQVFHAEVGAVFDNFGAAVVTVLLANGLQLFDDDLEDQCVA